ncbi:hypothetical protein [Aldersonia kunmingensis]|uniref:hypothetical protein n=1 Tax=Aldersonia kunmingensis TaxID=408066 RepID=UPI000830E51E|nr:hypothetical protein [Aldersonia kunmingensis]
MSAEPGSFPVASLAGSEEVLATHSVILALPALIPALLVVGVVVVIAVRDRRRGDDDPADENDTTDPD